MPASISVVAYITLQAIESINEYTIQKGSLPQDNTQLIKFTYFVTEEETENIDENESSTGVHYNWNLLIAMF